MRIIRAESVNSAFIQSMKSFSMGITVVNGEYIVSREGYDLFNIRQVEDETSPDKEKPMLEDSILFEITNPRDRLVYSKPMDLFNYAGLWMWLLRGDELAQNIAFYNDVARRFVDEEVSNSRLRASWGSRIVGSSALSKCIGLLREVPNTRRAVVPVFIPDDVGFESRNLPCLVSIQFATKNRQLDMYVTMRSQAAYGVMPYDMFLLTMLHEYVAMRSSHDLGTYYHWAPLLGLRQSEMKWVTAVATHDVNESVSMEHMPDFEPGKKAHFLDIEAKARRTGQFDFELMSMPPYWASLLWTTVTRYAIRKEDRSSVEFFWPNMENFFPPHFLNINQERIFQTYLKAP